MAWDYAKLSKAAKDSGGPEKFMELLIKIGKKIGYKEMIPLVIAAWVLGVFSSDILQTLKSFKKKETITSKSVETAKQELIQEIKECIMSYMNDKDYVSEVGGEKNE